MDFLRTIVISIPFLCPSLAAKAKQQQCPSDAHNRRHHGLASYAQHCQFQTELLSIVREYLSSAGVVVLGEQGFLPVVT